MKKLILIICVICAFMPTCSAETENTVSNIFEEQYKASGAAELEDKLDDDTKEILDDLGIDPSGVDSGGISVKEVFQKILRLLTDSVTSPVTASAAVLCAVMICSVFYSMYGERLSGINETADYIGAMCVCAAAVVPFSSSIAKMVSAISVCSGFMLAFVPVYCGILICLGRTASAAGMSTLVFSLAEAVARLSKSVITPLSGMYLALSVSCAFSPGMNLRGISSTVKRAVFWLLGTVMTVFTAVLAITGVVNAASDSVSQRTAKFLLGNLIPVAGGTISEAINTLTILQCTKRKKIGCSSSFQYSGRR